MKALHFIDTNVFLYSISRDDNEAQKRERAIEVLNEDNGAISVQVLQEFYVQATRASRKDPIPHDVAVGLMTTWTRFSIQDLTPTTVTGALEIKAKHGFSYWDASILAAARALGCSKLYTEDLSHGRQVDGILVINPFSREPASD